MRYLCYLLIMLGLLPAAVAHAQVGTTYFATIPTISPTTTLSAGHVCATDGRDIYCDGTLPLSAGLGINDRIISGSQATIINSATGVISLTTAGTSWGYLAPSGFSYLPLLNTLGVSVTGTVSATNGYFTGNMGLGTPTPQAKLDVSGTLRISYGNEACTTANAGALRYTQNTIAFCDNSSWKNLVNLSGNISVTTATYGANCSGVTTGNATATLSTQCNGLAYCNHTVSFSDTGGDPAVGCAKSFTVSYICGSSTSTTTVTASASADGRTILLGCGYSITADRIISGTDAVIVNGTTHTVSYSTNGTITGYSDANGNHILPGVSVSGVVSTSQLKLAALPGAPVSSTCVGGTDYGRIVQGSDNRLYLCVPR